MAEVGHQASTADVIIIGGGLHGAQLYNLGVHHLVPSQDARQVVAGPQDGPLQTKTL